jgi:hypothetical protein
MLALVTMFCFHSSEENKANAESELPASLLGFVKPGMEIGIRSSSKDSFFSIVIYDKEQFRFEKDARRLDLDELGQKYPKVLQETTKALAKWRSTMTDQLPPASEGPLRQPPVEPAVALDLDLTVTLCTVVHATDDYILVTYGDDNTKRQAIAKQAVSHLRWATDDLRFREFLRTVERPE